MNECCRLCNEPIPEQASVYCEICHPVMRDAFRAVLAVFADLIVHEPIRDRLARSIPR